MQSYEFTLSSVEGKVSKRVLNNNKTALLGAVAMMQADGFMVGEQCRTTVGEPVEPWLLNEHSHHAHSLPSVGRVLKGAKDRNRTLSPGACPELAEGIECSNLTCNKLTI